MCIADGDTEIAHRYSHVRGYVEANRAAVREMHRQVGNLVVGEDGVARCGLLVRHLVLPGDAANTERVLGFLSREISPSTRVNLMAQYRPCYRADDYPPLDRPITRDEYRAALEVARRYGLPLVNTPEEQGFH